MIRLSLIVVSIALWFCTASTSLYGQPSGYSFGKEIVIRASQVSGSGNLASFPVLISVTDPNLRTVANGGNVRNANGFDIIFMQDCISQLDHQIERYVATTGQYVAWVRIPSLSATTDTPIYMYYGNPSAVNTSTNNVWDANYVGVWHLNNNDLTDASGTGNNGTNDNSTNVANARIAGGRGFNGTNAAVQLPTSGWTSSSGTVSLWGQPNGFTNNHNYFFGHTTLTAYQNRIQIYTNNAGGGLDIGLGDNHEVAGNVATLAAGNWYYIVLTWNAGNYAVYVNNNAAVTGTYGGFAAIFPTAEIGDQGNPPAANESLNGNMDEIRVSNIARSLDWIRTEYNNQNNPSSFYTISAQMTAGATCALPVELILFEAIGEEGKVKLIWSTASETNNDYFTIERSKDGTAWEELKTVDGAGTTVERRRYVEWDDKPFAGRSYYRIKQTDFDGSFDYSWVRLVDLELTNTFRVYPNPATREFIIELDNAGDASVSLFNSLGQPLQIVPSLLDDRSIVVAIDQLEPGVYYLTVTNQGVSERKMIMVE